MIEIRTRRSALLPAHESAEVQMVIARSIATPKSRAAAEQSVSFYSDVRPGAFFFYVSRHPPA